MADSKHPVTIAVTRSDGSVEHVRVGTAIRRGEGFTVQLAELTIGAFAELNQPAQSQSQRPRSASPPPPSSGGGASVFPNYGRSKGAPIAGATTQDLEYYAAGARRSLADSSKSRFHEKERQLLTAIEAELSRQGGGSAAPPAPAADDYGAPPRDDDAPPPRDDDDFWRP